MATSDSDNFESADEDFEFDKSKGKHLPKKVFSCDTKDIASNLKTIHVDEDHSGRNEECSKNENTGVVDKQQELTDIEVNTKSEKTEKIDDVSVPVKTQTGVAQSSKPKRPQQVRVKNETSFGPKKLGTRLSATNKNNENISETQIPKNDDQSEPKSDEPRLVTIESAKTDSDINLVKRLPKHCNLPTIQQDVDSSKEVGDGWDVEEEDGFEIPSSLHGKYKRENLDTTPTNGASHPLEKISSANEKTENKGWGGWGSFGMGSLLSTATGSVSALSSHVTAGLSTVTSVLDNSLGAPDPESLAKSMHEEKVEREKIEVKEEENIGGDGGGGVSGGGIGDLGFSGFGSLVSGVSLLGSKVITGGLDTLETIGKKTMEVLQEGDPRLMKKRAMFFQEPEKPVLSQILREAKEKAENSDKEQQEKEELRQSNFEAIFDDFQVFGDVMTAVLSWPARQSRSVTRLIGLMVLGSRRRSPVRSCRFCHRHQTMGMVHLEALEMLSKQCHLKLQSTLIAHSGEALVDLQETLSEVKQLCELPEESEDEEDLNEEDFANKISEHVKGLHKSMTGSKIIEMSNSISERLKRIEEDKIVAKEVNKVAISTLAEFTALAMEIFHKSAELLLTKPHHSTADEAESLTSLTCTLCARVSNIANLFTELLTKEDPIANSVSITNIYKESANSGSYIQSACQLLLPVIQVGATS